jgi:NAD+ synthase (glutamine-hydrolysing)
MKLIKVGAAVLNQTPRDWAGNLANISEAISKAKEEKVTILCLPEATITGYGLEDDLFCADVPHRALLKLAQILPLTKGMIVSVGLPMLFNNTLYNAVATIVNGEVQGFTCKQHLAGDGIHYEQRHYKPWPAGVSQTVEIPEIRFYEEDPDGFCSPDIGKSVFPIGDVHFNIGGVKIGYEICEDAWVANRPGTVLASKGIDLYLNPSASHFSFGKINTRINFVVDGSRAFGATYIYTNLVGNESGRTIFDGGALIASGGTLIAQGARFTFQNVLLTTAVVDIDNTKTGQVRTASFQPDVEHYNKGCVNVPFYYPTVTERITGLQKAESWETGPDVKHEECRRAIGLALMDYMRKSHTNGFVVSLSGGADSAMVTYLASYGIEKACQELGVEKFLSKFAPFFTPHKANYFDKWSIDERIKHVTYHLITTAYQPTENSGNVTRQAATEVAKALGVPHMILDVDPIFKAYLKLGSKIKGSDLNFKDDGITLQNLQARIRAPGVWIIANMQNKLLLTTSNMSEAAVGYATMDGDTAGCVAPISGLPKVYIREFLKWAEGTCPALSYINAQQPTAELLPESYHQTDETDLMPYDLLHKIETYVVKNRYTPVEIYEALMNIGEYLGDEQSNILIQNITKFFRLFSRNQWKRERYALGFHMDDHNLDPRTWCRTPILTGGYEEELAELQKLIKIPPPLPAPIPASPPKKKGLRAMFQLKGLTNL